MKLSRFLPVSDLAGYDRASFRSDSIAAITVIFMGVPQGIAYAMIAGLPPAMGLYASTIPAIIGALFRSSRHVIAGPSNALSLLIGGALAVEWGADPTTVAITLAVLVGLMQVGAGLLGLGAIVDFISSPVVLGYITGAAVLIAVGQLPNLTATIGGQGFLPERLATWADGLAATSPTAVGFGLGTAVLVLVLRRINRRWPGPMIAMTVATVVSVVFGFGERGLMRIGDLSPIPAGLPPFTMPDWSLAERLLPFAIAATVLSLVEASAVARAIAGRTRQRLDSGVEFFGQGLANLAAGFFGGYPVSGSLARSGLNHSAGAKTRLAGAYSGVLMILVLLVFGPVVNETPISSLAGLLLIVAWDLIDQQKIKVALMSGWPDRITFLATLIGTWSMSLDKAIYLGVGISVLLLLRQARMLETQELTIDGDGQLHELGESEQRHDETIRILQLEGRLFFGVEGDLRRALDDATEDDRVRALVLRLKRTQGMDVTIATVLRELHEQLEEQGRHLLLAGVPKETLAMLERSGILSELGAENVFAANERWFESLGAALTRARTLTETSGVGLVPTPVH